MKTVQENIRRIIVTIRDYPIESVESVPFYVMDYVMNKDETRQDLSQPGYLYLEANTYFVRENRRLLNEQREKSNRADIY